MYVKLRCTYPAIRIEVWVEPHHTISRRHKFRARRLEGIGGRTSNHKMEEAALIGRLEGPRDESVHCGEVLLHGLDQDPGQRIHQDPMQVPSDALQGPRVIAEHSTGTVQYK